MDNNTTQYRFINSTRNAMVAVVTQILMGVASFIERMVFNHCFLADYLGILTLFTNVISILSVAELGLSTAIAYALYVPFAEGNVREINAITAFLKKVYRIVGTFIFVGGIACIPFLRFFIVTSIPVEYVSAYFIIFIINTSFEYYFCYKTVLFSASQREYISTLIVNICRFGMYSAQIVVSLFTRNFFLYAVCMFCFTIVRCILINVKANKDYEYLDKEKIKLSSASKNKILSNVKGLFVVKIGNSISSSTNSLLISAMVGTSVLGLYSNYQMITSGLLGFVSILPNAITASLGNIGAIESKEHVADSYNYIEISFFLVYGSVSIILFNIFNPIVSLFFGGSRCLPISSALFMCILFYIRNIKNLFGTYKSSLGLYWFDRKRPLVTGLVDLLLSIILGFVWGLNGIILGTIIAYSIIDMLIEPMIIFHRGFKMSSRKIILKTMARMIIVILMMLMTYSISSLLPAEGVTNLILRFVCSSAITFFIFFIIYHKNKYVIGSIRLLKKYLFKREVIL